MTELIDDRRKALLMLRKKRTGEPVAPTAVNAELEVTCKQCKSNYSRDFLKTKMFVCPSCGHHMKISARLRLRYLVDQGSFVHHDSDLMSSNPIGFDGYEDKLAELKNKTNRNDAIITGEGTIGGNRCAIALMDNSFMMGSMGTVVGERFTRIVEFAGKNNLPLVTVCTSGGARMQEGMFSLLQMAKTSQAIEKFKNNGGLYISVLTNPTTGGVSASFATLGDIIVAEPGALIGFAGPRVIEQTIKEKLPAGFQLAEFQEEHGMVDMIVEREDLKNTITKLLDFHQGGELHE